MLNTDFPKNTGNAGILKTCSHCLPCFVYVACNGRRVVVLYAGAGILYVTCAVAVHGRQTKGIDSVCVIVIIVYFSPVRGFP